MSQGSGIQLENRSWTADPSKTANRRVIVAILAVSLLALTGAFLTMLWSNSTGRTFVVSLAVTDYDERVPKPMFGVWDLQKFETIAKERGLKPWTFVPSSSHQDLQNKPDLEAAVNNLPEELKNKGLNNQDTLIVQLRCHAVVAMDLEGKWNCNLFVSETTDNKNVSANTDYPVYEFLKRLKKVPAKNIVLLADICDLKSVPHRGWLVNPVASYLLKACERLSGDSNVPDNHLWIVCAASDEQSTHYSAKRKQTLFQASCEHALQQIPKQNNLSLADYFDMTVRYCYSASEGKQTPQMIYANNKEVCKSNTDKSWQMAKQVMLSRNENRVKSKSETNNKSKETNSESNETTKSAGSQEPKDGNTEPSVLSSKDTPIKLDPDKALRFWQWRDRILQANGEGQKKWRWTPADFAPLLWRKLQMEASQDTAKAQTYEQELNLFYGLQESGAPASRDGGQLAQAWNDFLASNRNQRLWNDETILNEADRELWLGLRNEYRTYIDCLSELVFWRDLALEFEKELQTDVDRMFDVLEQARRSLPENASEFALGKSSGLRISDSVGKLRRTMNSNLSRIIDSVRRPGKLTWVDERAFQVLLASPLLRYEQRKELTELLSKKEVTDAVSQNDEDLGKLLIGNNPDGSASSKAEWYCKGLRRSTSFFSESPMAAPANEKNALLAWGQSYVHEISKLGEAMDKRTTLQRWHFLSLLEFGFLPATEPSKSHSGIVVSPTKSKAIRLSVRPDFELLDFPRERLESQLAVGIKYGDETDVAICELEWSVVSSKSNTLPGMQLLIGNKLLKRGSKESIQPNDKELKFNCKLPSDQIVPNQCSIQLVAFDQEGNPSNKLIIPIFRNATRIHLAVAQADGKVQKQLTIHNGDIVSFENLEQFDFKSPAVVGATSRYSFTLGNKQLKERKARLSVYAISRHAAFRLLENKIPEEFLLASSETIKLPAYSPNSQDVSAQLRTVKSASTTKPAMSIEAYNDLLIFQIDELETKGDTETVRGDPERWVGRFQPSNPGSMETGSTELVEVEPSPVERDQRLKIELKGLLEFWRKYGLKELPIKVHAEWIDLKSKNQSRTQLPFSLINLSSDNQVETFIGAPMDPNKSFQFDLDIGNYPRSMTYLAKPNSSKLERVFPARLEITDIKPLSKKLSKPVELKKKGQSWVFPNIIEGEAIAYDGIQIQANADFGLNQNATLVFAKEVGGSSSQLDSQEIENDRSVSVEAIPGEDGMLAVTYTPSELKIRQTKRIDKNLDGIYSIQLKSGNLVAKSELIFDRDPPGKSKIQCDAKPELRPGGKLEIWIEPDDGDSGSGVETVEFAISKDGELVNAEYNPNPNGNYKPLANPSWDGKRGRVYLDSSLLDGKPSGRIIIVARTVDKAGNSQTKNEPLSVNWDDKKPSENK